MVVAIIRRFLLYTESHRKRLFLALVKEADRLEGFSLALTLLPATSHHCFRPVLSSLCRMKRFSLYALALLALVLAFYVSQTSAIVDSDEIIALKAIRDSFPTLNSSSYYVYYKWTDANIESACTYSYYSNLQGVGCSDVPGQGIRPTSLYVIIFLTCFYFLSFPSNFHGLCAQSHTLKPARRDFSFRAPKLTDRSFILPRLTILVISSSLEYDYVTPINTSALVLLRNMQSLYVQAQKPQHV